jgi:transaldolase
MNQNNFSTKFFLDSADPNETRQLLTILKNLSGQTTNPSLVVKNPKIKDFYEKNKIDNQKLFELYKEAIVEILEINPNLDVSVEVYADQKTSFQEILSQAKEIQAWNLGKNIRVKFPSTPNGIEAAIEYLKHNGKINMTLIFNQFQAAAIQKASENLQTKDNIVISPFIGRLDDIQENGIDLIKNIQKMYKKSNSKIQILAASVRSERHLIECLNLKVDIITAGLESLKTISNLDLNQKFQTPELKEIPYQKIDFNKTWQQIYKNDKLTEAGLIKFADDWNAVLG